MNNFKQSKSSIIFQTCWTLNGAATDDVYDALDAAGFNMPIDTKLLPMLKQWQRKGWLFRKHGNWAVSQHPPKKRS